MAEWVRAPTLPLNLETSAHLASTSELKPLSKEASKIVLKVVSYKKIDVKISKEQIIIHKAGTISGRNRFKNVVCCL
ncbi:hypothetical protein HZS_4794 [Henneguya salminicola]|nr:hypothetical protein HZS_4794 [Henneguya salminicola]